MDITRKVFIPSDKPIRNLAKTIIKQIIARNDKIKQKLKRAQEKKDAEKVELTEDIQSSDDEVISSGMQDPIGHLEEKLE